MNKPLCTIQCEDCGRFAVMNNQSLTIFAIDEDFSAVTRCVFCDRIITNSLKKDIALSLFWDGIKVFDFNTGEQILDQKVFNRK